MRKDCYDKRYWDSSGYNVWVDSEIFLWLNNNYKSLFSPSVQNMMQSTNYYYTVGYQENSRVITRSDAVFLLSISELGEPLNVYFNAEGTALPIINVLQVAYFNGQPDSQWTRSPNKLDKYNAGLVMENGNMNLGGTNVMQGSRPVFSLPKTAFVDQYLNLVEE